MNALSVTPPLQSLPRLFGSVLLALTILSGLFAPPVQAEDISAVYSLATQHDPAYRAAGNIRRAAGETTKQAWAEVLPQLSASYQMANTTQDIISSDNTVFAAGGTSFDSTEYALTLRQPLFRYASFVRIGKARREVEQADYDYTLAGQDLILRVSETYLKALSAGDELSFAEAELAALEQHFELAQARFDMGLVPVTDLYDARARLSSVVARKIEAENLLSDSRQALAELTGRTVTELAGLKESIPLDHPDPQDMDAWVATALKQNLGILSLEKGAEVARRELRRQKSAHLPTLDLTGQFKNEVTDGTLFGGGSEVETTEYMLQFNLPIYEGGIVTSRTRQARELYGKAKEELDRQRRAVVRQVQAAYNGVNSAISQVEALKETVEFQNLTLEAKQEGYRSGIFTSLAVLDAERDLHLARRDYAQGRYNYILNRLKLKQTVGTLAEEDLFMVNEWLGGAGTTP